MTDQTTTPKPPAPPVAKSAEPAVPLLDFVEAQEGLTGYDELAIADVFGKPFSDLSDTSIAMSMRALLFVQKKRDGADTKTAKAHAMSLTIKQVMDSFADIADSDADEAVAGEPLSAAGKGEPQPE